MGRVRIWLSRNERAVAGCVMALALLTLLTLKLGRSEARALCVAFGAAAYRIKKRLWVPIVAYLAIAPVGMYASFWYMVENVYVRNAPVWPLPAVHGRVYLGGDLLRLHGDERCFEVTVCFYLPGTDLSVVAAHSCDTAPGQTFRASLTPFAATGAASPLTCPQEDPAAVTVSVVSDTDFGVLVSGIRCPDSGRKSFR